MSNYKWVKTYEGEVLRREDFSPFPIFSVKSIDPILMKKLLNNDIDVDIAGDEILEDSRYELFSRKRRVIKIIAPLYKYNRETDQYDLISDAYTGEVVDAVFEYEQIKEKYNQCKKEIAEEQKKIFEELFEKASLDGGISSCVTISSPFYAESHYFNEKYVPKGYIEVCVRKCPFDRNRQDIVFLRKIDAKGQVVTIKVQDIYKGLVIGTGGMNIKMIAKEINAKMIKVL